MRKISRERRHGLALQKIFPATKGMDPEELVASLAKVEKAAHKLAEDECNRPLPDGYVERRSAEILGWLDSILAFKAAKVPVFLNGDPRGYALKIQDGYVRARKLDIERDWGGYGILAPEF